MPTTNSAKKALRQSKKIAERNLQVKKGYKTAVKSIKKAVEKGEKGLTEKVKLAQKKLDKAAKAGVIKKNTASRKMARLMKQVNAVEKK